MLSIDPVRNLLYIGVTNSVTDSGIRQEFNRNSYLSSYGYRYLVKLFDIDKYYSGIKEY